jgi:hypothetical protein
MAAVPIAPRTASCICGEIRRKFMRFDKPTSGRELAGRGRNLALVACKAYPVSGGLGRADHERNTFSM